MALLRSQLSKWKAPTTLREGEVPVSPRRPTLAIDFDGTIAETGGPDHDVDSVKPRPGAKESLERFWDAGFRIIIWTGREDLEAVEDWLDEYKIPYDLVNHDNPDWPTGSRKIRADLYIDDKGVNASQPWQNILRETFYRLGKKKHQRTKHIVIAGYSGSGKTTLSKRLSEQTGLPIWKIDNDRLWRENKRLAKDWDCYTKGTEVYKSFRKVLKKLVRRALRRKQPHILEGCHFLVTPGTLRGHRLVVIDADESTIVRQRLKRDHEKGKLSDQTYQQRIEKAQFLYRKLKPSIDLWKKIPGVEIVSPGVGMERWLKAFNQSRRSRKKALPGRPSSEFFATCQRYPRGTPNAGRCMPGTGGKEKPDDNLTEFTSGAETAPAMIPSALGDMQKQAVTPVKNKLIQAKVVKLERNAPPDRKLWNVSYRATLEDGTQGMWKPEVGEGGGPGAEGQTAPVVYQWMREVGTFAVAEAVNLTDLTPTTVQREVHGEQGSMQGFVPNATDAGNFRYNDRFDGERDLARAAAFDYLIGNMDRHAGNWMIQNGKLVLVDHGFTFPNTGTRDFRSQFYDEVRNRNMAIPEEVKNWDERKIFEAIRKYPGIRGRAVRGVIVRLRQLKAAAGTNQWPAIDPSNRWEKERGKARAVTEVAA